MRIALLSLDEVNTSLAGRLAAIRRDGLEVYWPKDGLPGAEFEAVLIDLDHWPTPIGQVINALGPRRYLAVFSYALRGRRRIRALRRKGLAVFRRLGPGVFRSSGQADSGAVPTAARMSGN